MKLKVRPGVDHVRSENPGTRKVDKEVIGEDVNVWAIELSLLASPETLQSPANPGSRSVKRKPESSSGRERTVRTRNLSLEDIPTSPVLRMNKSNPIQSLIGSTTWFNSTMGSSSRDCGESQVIADNDYGGEDKQ